MSDNNIKSIALESSNILQIRQKIMDRSQKESKEITPEKVNRIKDQILKYISLNVNDRLTIDKGEDLSLFNHNRSPAPESKAVLDLQNKIQELVSKNQLN